METMTDTLRTLIVDDEPLARQAISHFAGRLGGLEIIGECGDGRQAVERISRGGVDLVFLDIQMPDLSGFNVVEAFPQESCPAIIFVTAYDDRAVEAFETEAIDYLLKPLDEARFERAVDRVRRRLNHQLQAAIGRKVVDALREPNVPKNVVDQAGSRIPMRSFNRTLFVDPDSIQWIEAAEYCARLHRSGKVESVRETMAALEQALPDDRFFRIHRSYIVNLDFVREVQPAFHGDFVVVMDDGTELRLSRTRRRAFERRLGKSL